MKPKTYILGCAIIALSVCAGFYFNWYNNKVDECQSICGEWVTMVSLTGGCGCDSSKITKRAGTELIRRVLAARKRVYKEIENLREKGQHDEANAWQRKAEALDKEAAESLSNIRNQIGVNTQ